MFPCLIAKKEDVAKLTPKKEECNKRLKNRLVDVFVSH